MKATRSLTVWFAIFTLSLGVSINSLGAAAEKIELKDLPEAVQKGIKAKTGDKTISSIAKKGEGEKATYAATFKGTGGSAGVITVGLDGKFVKSKEDAKLKDLPEAVQATIKTKVGDKTISKVEKKVKDDKTTYAATVKGTDAKETLITVDADGKFNKMADVAPKKDSNTAAKPETK